MTQQILLYILIAGLSILVIFSFAVGLEKMIKILLGNYILSSITWASGSAIELLIRHINTDPSITFFGIGSTGLINFLTNGKTTIILILYISLIVFIYKKSKIHISLPMDDASKKITQILFVPLTVISIILTLQIALLGMDVGSLQGIARLGETIAANPYLNTYISLTPVWIVLHGIITIFFTSELKIRATTELGDL